MTRNMYFASLCTKLTVACKLYDSRCIYLLNLVQEHASINYLSTLRANLLWKMLRFDRLIARPSRSHKWSPYLCMRACVSGLCMAGCRCVCVHGLGACACTTSTTLTNSMGTYTSTTHTHVRVHMQGHKYAPWARIVSADTGRFYAKVGHKLRIYHGMHVAHAKRKIIPCHPSACE
jgi:hypothetical protein